MAENNELLKPVPIDIEKWQLIIAAWESSNESQRNYCKRLGLNIHTFTYARSKIKPPKKQNTKFVPVEIHHSQNKNTIDSDLIIIENKQGYRLYISSGLSVDRLTKIFKLSGW